MRYTKLLKVDFQILKEEIAVSLLNRIVDDGNRRRSIDRRTGAYVQSTVGLLEEVVDDSKKRRSIDGGTEVYVQLIGSHNTVGNHTERGGIG